MTLDWQHFTPWTALAGGLLIGLAAALFLFINGRIAGISGILGGLLRAPAGDRRWRVAFLLGLMAAPFAWRLFAGMPEAVIEASTLELIAAGLLVGYGTQMGSGCTSGHGVCGVSRASPRSVTATLLFMAAGFVTVYVARHVLGGAV